MTDFWQNRIVESGAASPEELAKGMNPLNWRGHIVTSDARTLVAVMTVPVRGA